MDCSEYIITDAGNKVELLRNSKFGNVLVIGCFHGDEPQGKYLIEKYISIHPENSLLAIPCLNPDGLANNSRVNRNGVDLNRNFPTKNWVLSKKDNYYGGNKPASEKETRFLIEIIEKYKPELILTLHSPYKVVNYDGDAENIAQKISKIINYPVEKSIGYPTPGSFGTWAGIERHIPTITLELDEEVDIKELEKPVFDIFELVTSMQRTSV
ncbi:MAG: DUF2817 domain-containing protein [bacterium]|nr:DUF2817 domain-containing protein [bacterium]